MSFLIRPLEPSDAPQLVARFATTGRAPWVMLTHPWRLTDFLIARKNAETLVARRGDDPVLGAVRVVRRETEALLLGPLVSDDQLAELLARSLVKAAETWATGQGCRVLRTRVPIHAEQGLTLYRALGFHLSQERHHILALQRSRIVMPTVPEPYRMGPWPGLLSRDYLVAVATIFGESAPQLRWSRAEAFEYLQRPDVFLVVCREGDRLVGLVELLRRDDDFELVNVGLAPALRGQNLGRSLIATSLHHAFEFWGAQRVWVGATGDDIALRSRLLRPLGFSQGNALILFEKMLNAKTDCS